MDELVLRGFIQKVSKDLLANFSQYKSVEERLEFVQSHEEIKAIASVLNDDGSTWPIKDSSVAQQNREDGNEAFQAGNYELALLLYSESVRYSPVNPNSWEGEELATSAANRSAALFQLKRFSQCLADIELALGSGYPKGSAYKLHIRQCKCLLELGRIVEAQKAFDQALDAIDRSGLNKGLRKDLAVDLQGAFINLAKCVTEDEKKGGNISAPPSTKAENEDQKERRALPPWTKLKEAHPKYPAASRSISIRYNEHVGRHVVATRNIAAGEVIFHEDPIVSVLIQEDDASTEACHHCFLFLHLIVPCPTCSFVVFCSLQCRNEALATYHKTECKLGPVLRSCKLDRLPLITMVLRAVTQKGADFFSQRSRQFQSHNLQNGVEGDDNEVFRSDDYKNLFHLVTHSDRREKNDLATKTVFATFLVLCLKSVGFFEDNCCQQPDEMSQKIVARLLYHFLECFQFNTHMVECIYQNRLISQDAETRIWKSANKFATGEFVETVRLGGAIYPTLANVNHSCDPNLILLNWGKTTVAFANRPIKAGEQIFDTYGAVFYHMDKVERQDFLQHSHWFLCGCDACKNDWPVFTRLPREYLKLPGTHFRHKRCNRKALQKDIEKIKKRIRENVLDANLDACIELYMEWIDILDELLVPPHQDFVNVRRGIRNCFWLKSPNICRVREDEELRAKKEKYEAALANRRRSAKPSVTE